MNKTLNKSIAITILTIVALSVIPSMLVLLPQAVSAQLVTKISASSPNLVEGKVIEILIEGSSGLGELRLEVFEKEGGAASLVDKNDVLIPYGGLVATEIGKTGIYVAYLGGSGKTEPKNHKVPLDSDVGDNKVNIAWFAGGVDGKTYVIRVIGTDQAVEVLYDYVTSVVRSDRSEYPFSGYIRITVVDQDINKDPTLAEEPSSDDILVTNVKVVRPATGETFEKSVSSTSFTEVFFGGTATDGRETGVNKGEFVFEASLSDLEDYLANLFGDFGKFKNNDIISIKIKGNEYDPEEATLTFRVRTVTPVPVFEAVSFAEGVKISINWFDHNLKSWEKDEIPAGVVSLILLKDGSAVDTESNFKLTETGLNTGIFAKTIDLTYGTAPSNNDGKIMIDPADVKAGSKFTLKLMADTVERYYSITFNAPQVTLDETEYYVTDTVVVTMVDPDLNDDSKALESYKCSLSAGGELKSKQLSKAGMTFVEVSLKDLTVDKFLIAKQDIDLILAETDLNTGEFKLKIDLSKLELPAGESFEGHKLRLTILDYTSNVKVEKDFMVLKLTRQVSLDRTTYPVPKSGETLYVYVKVIAPDQNIDPDAKDTIPPGVVYIDVMDISGGKLAGYPTPLSPKETDIDTGIFEDKITLSGLGPIFIGGKILVWYDEDGDGAYDSGEPSDTATFSLTTATMSVSPMVVEKYGDKIRVEIRDPDKNLDSKAKNKVSFTVTVDATPLPSFEAEETDANTGIFVKELKVCGPNVGCDVGVEPTKKIKIKYVDEKTASSSASAGFVSSTIELEVIKKSYTGKISLDKEAYGPSASVKITVIDPDLNKDPSGKDPGVSVKVTVEGVTSTTVPLEETEVNSGVFEGKLNLQGVGTPKELVGKRILAVYEDEYDEVGKPRPLTSIARIISTDPIIKFNKDYYVIGDVMEITIEDLDANENPDSIDPLSINVYSDSIEVRTPITAYETEVNTALFKAYVIVSDTFGSGKIYVKYGDKIYVEYKDKFPADYATTEKQKIFNATAPVGVPIERPIEVKKASFIDPRTGAAVVPKVGSMVGISVELSNVGVSDQVFTAILVVKDPDGIVVKVDSVTIPLGAGKSGSVTFSFTPKVAGDFGIEVYVVKSLADWSPLGEKLAATMTVAS